MNNQIPTTAERQALSNRHREAGALLPPGSEPSGPEPIIIVN